jgi:tetratricopeptide (TPR) repeat protein
VEDLLALSVAANLAHRPTWDWIVQLRRDGRLPVAHLGRFFDVLIDRTAKAYPDYSCQLVQDILPTIDDFEQRREVYERAMQVYGRRPDLRGRLYLAVGDDYLRQGEPAEALRAYELAATRCVDLAAIVLEAARRAETLLMENDRADLAIRMYQKLFEKAKPVKTAFPSQTAHYRLGRRLATLLERAGRDDDARRILHKIAG